MYHLSIVHRRGHHWKKMQGNEMGIWRECRRVQKRQHSTGITGDNVSRKQEAEYRRTYCRKQLPRGGLAEQSRLGVYEESLGLPFFRPSYGPASEHIPPNWGVSCLQYIYVSKGKSEKI